MKYYPSERSEVKVDSLRLKARYKEMAKFCIVFLFSSDKSKMSLKA